LRNRAPAITRRSQRAGSAFPAQPLRHLFHSKKQAGSKEWFDECLYTTLKDSFDRLEHIVGLILESLVEQVLTRSTRQAIAQLLSNFPRHDFAVRFWDGSSWGNTQQPRFTLVINHPRVLRKMFLSPTELSLGECYIFGELDVEGDLEAAFELGNYLVTQKNTLSPLGVRLAELLEFSATEVEEAGERGAHLAGAVHSMERDRQAIRYHYDLPPEFFALWLDRRKMYSCAYFASEDEADLDTAQYRKLDYICKKLRLHPGETLLDIGCGWGGLLAFAATHYDVEVLGITLSIRQAEVTRKRIHELGLNQRCRVEVCDYRSLSSDRQFEKIVSLGMFEHVGERHLPEYFSQVWQLLSPGGAFLNTGISASPTYERQRPSFIEKYVFPDGELVPVSSALSAAEFSGFEIRDVESLREHYGLTLRLWVQRLESHAELARQITDETTYRIWRLYMAGSAYAFRTGRINIYQVLFAKPQNGDSGMPLTRADWYRAHLNDEPTIRSNSPEILTRL
jgi:cyclopropane-fatty-acyl-phospholipid synthase